ncbi:MAG: dienelactone hydrolase family protein [Candidatus Rokuibacteriota bacterium]|nr:MAG: dienelactone hydrolase family protein [Candidatus Rokubacteria bacterium]
MNHGIVVLIGAALLAGCAGAASELSIATTSPTGAAEHIASTLSKPEGPGPFPAVVIMHDCSGLGPRSSGAPDRWAKELVERGYVTLVPDSFTARGFPNGVCTDPSPRRADVSPLRRNRDAYAALAHLRTLPFVDGRRVGLMGGSHGGSTTLTTMAAPDNDQSPQARERLAGFAAAVALYPGCAGLAARGYRPVAPVLILIGEKDDWTPAEPCRVLTEAAQQAEHPVTIKIYPGAYHSFDSHNPVRYVATRVNSNAPGGRGATTGGDPAAWADSIRQVVAFFDRYLK